MLGPHRPTIPSVGCVIVKDGAWCVGEARHRARAAGRTPRSRRWRPAGDAARGAAAYVTLEPCGERSAGRGRPARERLVAAGVARVVDRLRRRLASPPAAGVARLQAAGVRSSRVAGRRGRRRSTRTEAAAALTPPIARSADEASGNVAVNPDAPRIG